MPAGGVRLVPMPGEAMRSGIRHGDWSVAIGGKNAKGGGWSAPYVAMGTGIVHIPRVATVLAEIGFDGPSELQSEYRGIGGAERGADKITRPRQFVIGLLKRDVITIRKSFEMANCGIAI